MPVLVALLLWFCSTAAIVWLDSRPPTTFAASYTVSGLVAAAAMAVIAVISADTGPAAAYASFIAAIAIWAWHEMGFLMGFVAGPRRAPCPPGAAGWERFRLATATVIHHEVALAANALLLFAVAWGQPNQAGPLAFLLLFVLRLSAKFNLFFGVPNLSDEVFPDRLDYLKSYFPRRACNVLFPVSIAFAAGLAWWAGSVAQASNPEGGPAVAASLLATLAALGLIEHLFLVVPLRDSALWRWASSRKAMDAGAAKELIDMKSVGRI